MKAGTLTWIVLMLLTVTSFVIGGGATAWFVITAAGVKAALVGWQFMELRYAHPIWAIALFALLAAILGVVGVLV